MATEQTDNRPQTASIEENNLLVRPLEGSSRGLLVAGIVILILTGILAGTLIHQSQYQQPWGTLEVLNLIMVGIIAILTVGLIFFVQGRFVAPTRLLIGYLIARSRGLPPPDTTKVPTAWRPWFNILHWTLDNAHSQAQVLDKSTRMNKGNQDLVNRFSWVFIRNEELAEEIQQRNQDLQKEVTRHKQTSEELRRHRDHLDEMVRLRTNDLTHANLKLKETNRQLQKAIQKANEMALQAKMANQAKGQFLSNMSHEIRTPLNAVLGFTDMLLETTLTASQKDQLTTIKRSGDTLLTLLNDILDFSKIEAGELLFEKIDFDPELLAYDICKLVQPKIENNPVEIICHIGSQVPSPVKGDPTRFRQVLINLMSNAVKFTAQGEIELRLEVEDEVDDRVLIKVSVRDTGIGLSADAQQTIFQPFRQADGTTTRKFGGTGLGLSICKQIAKLMEGDVWATNNPDRGCTFCFTAWLGKVELQEPARPAPVSLAMKKVLVIDENLTSLNNLERMLKAAQMEVLGLDHADGAVQIIKEAHENGHPFDICITELHIRGMDGYQLAREIRQSSPPLNQLALLGLSSTMEGDGQRCREAAINGFLSKPVIQSQLFSMLDRIASAPQPQTAAQASATAVHTRHSLREEQKRAVRILVVEDNPVNQKLVEMMLTKAGYQIEIAASGAEAIDRYTAEPHNFDLIFMDIQMPKMDGLEATRAIRKWEAEQQGDGALDEKSKLPLQSAIPIVAMTAHAMKQDRDNCLAAGMNDYLTKPIKRQAVFQVIEEIVLKGDSDPYAPDPL